YREYDLAHLKLVFDPSIYKVWKSVRYGVSKELDTAYWGFLGARIRRIFLDGYGVLVFRIVIFKISSFKLQNARLLLTFTNYSIIIANLKYKRLGLMDRPDNVVFRIHYNGVFKYAPLRYEQFTVLEMHACTIDRVMFSHLLDMLVSKLKDNIWALFFCMPELDIQTGG
ncbi:hypothetical protein Tco_1494823, partial [Tanacetum coccineum]